MTRMRDMLHPAFTDMTWGAGGSTADLSLELALYAQKTGHVSNMHLTCTNIAGESDPKKAVLEALQKAHQGGIRNIVALRGDPPAGEEEWKAADGGFTCALDLVKYIREKFGSDFGISVAGYPEGHPNAISEIQDVSTLSAAEKARSSTFDGKTYCCLEADYKKEMDYLKQKVDAGAGTYEKEINREEYIALIVRSPLDYPCFTYLSLSSWFFLANSSMLSSTITLIPGRLDHYSNVL